MAADGAWVRGRPCAVAISVPLRASVQVFRSRESVRRCLPPPAQSCEPLSRRQVERVLSALPFLTPTLRQPTLREHHGREQGRVNREDSAKTRGQGERKGKCMSPRTLSPPPPSLCLSFRTDRSCRAPRSRRRLRLVLAKQKLELISSGPGVDPNLRDVSQRDTADGGVNVSRHRRVTIALTPPR